MDHGIAAVQGFLVAQGLAQAVETVEPFAARGQQALGRGDHAAGEVCGPLAVARDIARGIGERARAGADQALGDLGQALPASRPGSGFGQRQALAETGEALAAGADIAAQRRERQRQRAEPVAAAADKALQRRLQPSGDQVEALPCRICQGLPAANCATQIGQALALTPPALAGRSCASRSGPPAPQSARTGTAISAAAVGVGARRSAAKSVNVVSVSWPTAEISGDFTGSGGADHDFLVEAPEVLKAAPAPR